MMESGVRFPASAPGGLIILVLVWFLNLSGMASLTCAVALPIFLAISIGHLRIRRETGANTAVLPIGVAESVAVIADACLALCGVGRERRPVQAIFRAVVFRHVPNRDSPAVP